jgi:hypothetical protein
MASVSQFKLQLKRPVKYTGGEAVLPPTVTPPPLVPRLVIAQGVQAEGTDLGVIKVENGKFVLDTDDIDYNFDPDFGVF